MIALLDANILIDIGKAGLVPRLVEVHSRAPWRITREVFDECTTISEGQRQLLANHVRPSPLLGTPEAELCKAMGEGQHEWTKLGVGEASSIAAALHEPNTLFVSWDQKAVWRSLHELAGRTTVGHAWLRDLVDQKLIDKEEANRVARANPSRRHPSWW